MKNLTQEENENIVKTANEWFDGDIKLASAAHIYGVFVVRDVGSQIAEWFDKEKIEAVAAEVQIYLDAEKGGAEKDDAPNDDAVN